MRSQRGREPEKLDTVPGPLEQLLRDMPAWTEKMVPPDLVFDVSMRRRVLCRVPAVLARQGRRRVLNSLRFVAAAAAVFVLAAGVTLDLRAQVPPVVELEKKAAGTLSAPAPAAPRSPAGAIEGLAAAERPARVRVLPVVGPAKAEDGQSDQVVVSMRGMAGPAATPTPLEVHETALAEPVVYAGRLAGEAAVVTGTGRVWRYVEGSLVGGEKLLPASGGAGSLVLLPGSEQPVALWLDAQGNLHLDGQVAAAGLPGEISRLCVVPEGGAATTVLAAGSLRDKDRYEVQVWSLSWQGGSLTLAGDQGAPYSGPDDPDLLDLAAYRRDRGLTVYVALRAGKEEMYFLGEGRDGRMRWRRLPEPIFRPGTAVASGAGTLAGVDPVDGGVAVLEWVPSNGVTAWFRPGVYRVRRLSFPELEDVLRSVHYFDPDNTGQEGLLLVGQGGRVGYVDPALVSRH